MIQEPIQSVGGRVHMEIARVAKRLWNEAGRPAGRYIEYWAKAERAVNVTHDEHSLQAMVVSQAQKASPPEMTGPPLNSEDDSPAP